MIRIVADTTTGIPVPKALEMGISYLPQVIIFGEKSYRDDNELDTKTFLKMLVEAKQLPKTAAPPHALYSPIYEKFGKAGDTVIVICPSAKQSGTARSATVAAQDYPDADIRILDSQTIGAGFANIVIKAKQWADQDMDADTLVSKIEDLANRERNYFVVDTLEFLHKGGRIGGASALVGGLLQVKPILSIRDGQAEAVESQRTHRRALNRLKEFILNECPKTQESCLSVMHGDAEESAQKLANELAETMGIAEVPIYELPPAFLVHAGPGVLGVTFFAE